MSKVDEANEIIEKAIGEMYRGYFRLRRLGEYQEEYDSMGSVISILMKDRQTLREKYKDLKV